MQSLYIQGDKGGQFHSSNFFLNDIGNPCLKRIKVSDDVERVPGAGEGDVEPLRLLHEPDGLRPHAADDDHVALGALK